MQENGSSDSFLPKDINDDNNEPYEIHEHTENEFKMRDIPVTGAMKVLFIMLCLAGIAFSVYTFNITGILVFSVSCVFIMDMLGMLDLIKQTKKDMTKPRGYENIE